MRRVDRRTNALPTDRQTDRPTDTASYRGALAHLKNIFTDDILFSLTSIKPVKENQWLVAPLQQVTTTLFLFIVFLFQLLFCLL